MATVNVRTLKDRLSGFLRRAEGGERIVVIRGGRPVAALVPIAEMPASDEADTLARLAAEGAIMLPEAPVAGEVRFAGPLVDARGRSAAAMVIEDRR